MARTGGSATVQALAETARARVLHLATHTGAGSRGPWLALAEGKVGAEAIVGQSGYAVTAGGPARSAGYPGRSMRGS